MQLPTKYLLTKVKAGSGWLSLQAMWLSHLKDAQDKYKEACLKNPDGHGFQSSPGSPRGSLVPELLRPHTLLDRTQSTPSRSVSGILAGQKSSPGTSKREFGGAADSRADQGAVNQAVSTTTLAEIVIQEQQESDSSGAAAGETDTPPLARAPPSRHTFAQPGTSASSSLGYHSPQLLRPRSRTPTETRSISPPPTPGRPRSRDRTGRRLNTLRALHEKAKSMDIVFI